MTSFGLAFDAILNFLGDLAEAFPESSAERYFNFVREIKVSDKKEQEKHVRLFAAFCVANRDAILENHLADFEMHKFYYDDEEEPFNIQEIFDHKDFADNAPDILRHLLTISAIVDNESGAKQVLATMSKSQLFQDTSIANLFGEITKGLEHKENAELDPLSTIEGIVQADAFKKLVTNIVEKTQSGEIDLKSLLSGMSNMGKLMEGIQSQQN